MIQNYFCYLIKVQHKNLSQNYPSYCKLYIPRIILNSIFILVLNRFFLIRYLIKKIVLFCFVIITKKTQHYFSFFFSNFFNLFSFYFRNKITKHAIVKTTIHFSFLLGNTLLRNQNYFCSFFSILYFYCW